MSQVWLGQSTKSLLLSAGARQSFYAKEFLLKADKIQFCFTCSLAYRRREPNLLRASNILNTQKMQH